MPKMRRAIIGTFPNDSKTKWPIILQNESSNISPNSGKISTLKRKAW